LNIIYLTNDSSSVGEDGGGMGNNWGSVGDNWGMVSWGGMGNDWGSSVGWGSLISDVSNITIIVIGVILDSLDSTIGKVDRVLTINDTSSIVVLSLVESSTRVVISNSIGVRVWGNLSKVISNISSLHWGMVSWGSMSNNWGMISWCSMSDDRGSMSNNWGSNGTVSNNWGVDGVNSVGDNSISTVKSVGGISNNSSVGSESLALCCASVFSLVWFANRLMADLSVSISSDWSVSSVVDWSNGARDWGWEDWGMDGSVGNETNATGTGSGENGAQTQESLHVYLLVFRR